MAETYTPQRTRVKTEEYDYMNPPVIPCFYLGPGRIIWALEEPFAEKNDQDLWVPKVGKDGKFSCPMDKRVEVRRVYPPKPRSYEKMYGFEQFRIMSNPEGGGGYKVIVVKDGNITFMADGYCEIPDTPFNREKIAKLNQPHDRPQRTGPIKDRDQVTIGKRVMHMAFTEAPLFKKAKGLRSFDEKGNTIVDRIRPWKRRFMKVPQAIMEDVEGAV